MGRLSLCTFVMFVCISMITAKTEDGQKQVDAPAVTESTTTAIPFAPVAPPKQEEMACLAACHSCLQGFPVSSRKKKDDDNCGPMCDCADSCFFMPVEQVGDIYNQISSVRHGRNCWWRSYNQFLANAK